MRQIFRWIRYQALLAREVCLDAWESHEENRLQIFLLKEERQASGEPNQQQEYCPLCDGFLQKIKTAPSLNPHARCSQCDALWYFQSLGIFICRCALSQVRTTTAKRIQ